MTNKIRIELLPFYFLLFAICILVGFTIVSYFISLNELEESKQQCEKLDMQYFDSSYSMITNHKQTTCWNPITKEVKIIAG